MDMDPMDHQALCASHAKIGKELANLSPELLRLIELAADWEDSRLLHERRKARSAMKPLERIKAEREAERILRMARMMLGECITFWQPKQIKESNARHKAARAAAAQAKEG